MTAEALPAPTPAPSPAPELAEPDDRRRRRRLIILLLLVGLLAVLLGLLLWYLLFRQPLPLPPIPTTPQMPGYTTSIYGAARPTGVAVSSAGDRIYVTETEGDQVARVFDAGGNQLATLEPPASTGTEHVPVYVAIDPLTEEVYVSDRPVGTIYVYNRDGVFQREFRPPAELDGWQPLGIAFDASGWLYVTDLAGEQQQVAVIDRSGALARTFGAEAGLNFPNGIALDGAGNAYVTDSNNGRLLVFDTAGVLVAQVGRGVGVGNLGLPRGVTIDSRGRVYVIDTTGQGVFVYDVLKADQQRLDYLGFFGDQGIEDGAFQYPTGGDVDDRGRVYVADTVNDRIQVWSY
jgi:DNA-binding beta-propeller fold protein YncE